LRKLVRIHDVYRKEVEDAIGGVLFGRVCLECRVGKTSAESGVGIELARVICRGKPVSMDVYVEELGNRLAVWSQDPFFDLKLNRSHIFSRFLQSIVLLIGCGENTEVKNELVTRDRGSD
jgi:hypothetical protein